MTRTKDKTYLHGFRIYCQCFIFINSGKWNFLIPITQCSNKKFEDVKRCMFASGCKSKGVWSIKIYSQEILRKSMDSFNIENVKSNWTMNSGGKFEISIVGPLVILVALVDRQIGKGYYNPGRFLGDPPWFLLLYFFSLTIETWPKRWWISWERFCFDGSQKAQTKIFLFIW